MSTTVMNITTQSAENTSFACVRSKRVGKLFYSKKRQVFKWSALFLCLCNDSGRFYWNGLNKEMLLSF